MMDLSVKALSPEFLDDFFAFFDRVAFSDNPDWASCYCFYFHVAGDLEHWGKRTREENRSAAEEFIRTGKMNGYLAYVNGSPVGWCNANSKWRYAKLSADKELADLRDEKAGSIVCFVIAPGFRKRGIARRLLEAACEGFDKNGHDWVEAYPRKNSSSDAQHYHGPLSMYQKAGFEIYKEFPDYFIVRKRL
jgi:ribosomal protein S18 acetylase RimI-like enzyme